MIRGNITSRTSNSFFHRSSDSCFHGYKDLHCSKQNSELASPPCRIHFPSTSFFFRGGDCRFFRLVNPPAVFRPDEPTFFTPPYHNNTPPYRVRERENTPWIRRPPCASIQAETVTSKTASSQNHTLNSFVPKHLSASLGPQPSFAKTQVPPLQLVLSSFPPLPLDRYNGLLAGFLCPSSFYFPSLFAILLPPPVYFPFVLLLTGSAFAPRLSSGTLSERSRQLPPAKRRFFI
ncbi:hypothetical protein BJX76DRAFT_8205 [Aspergillus varians]